MILERTAITPTSPLVSLTQTPADLAFHRWCDALGVGVSPAVQLVTSPRSVGGRGVFAVEPLRKNNVIASIPNAVVFHPSNAAECFPETFQALQNNYQLGGLTTNNVDEQPSGNFAWIQNLWTRLFHQDQHHFSRDLYQDDDSIVSELWQLELTEYALAACNGNSTTMIAQPKDHPWTPWIQQWQRDDPVHRLLCSGTAYDDEVALQATAAQLHQLVPILSPLALQAALSIRLERFHRHQQLVRGSGDGSNGHQHHDEKFAAMYSLVGSRAAGLGGGVTGVIPFHDMINHSLDPNLSLAFYEDHLELCCNRDISIGEELLLQYTKAGEPMGKMNALWALVQWGIPTAESDIAVPEDST